MMPLEKLDAQITANVPIHFFQFLRSLLRFGSGWGANHALRTRPSRPGCKRTPRGPVAELGSSSEVRLLPE
jgi:hypothetical protein